MFHVKPRIWALVMALATPASATDPVRFPGPGVELAGVLHRPSGTAPFPAIVMLHGCSGLWTQVGDRPAPRYRFWAEHFRARGFLVLLVDSFGPRGEREICTQDRRRISEARDRPQDAHAALRWLAGRDEVDPNRISLMGWSNGAMATMHALRTDAPGRNDGALRFRSAVAFYPGCSLLARTEYRPLAPLLIQAGASDDWTPAHHCETVARSAAAAGAEVEIDVYDGAHHGFDFPGGAIRTRPDVRNPSSPKGKGATVGPHPVARARAVARVTAYLESR